MSKLFIFKMFCFLFLLVAYNNTNAQIEVVVKWNYASCNNNNGINCPDNTEPGWFVVDQNGIAVACAQGSATLDPSNGSVTWNPVPEFTFLSLPAGTYEIIGYDSYGDGWEGGASLDVLSYGSSVLPSPVVMPSQGGFGNGAQAVCAFSTAAFILSFNSSESLSLLSFTNFCD